MNTPTRQAPHICDQVLAKISLTWLIVTRSRSAVIIHDARIAVPATNGFQSNTAVILAPGVIAESAVTTKCPRTMDGKSDHGPVQATTTATRTAIGSQAVTKSPPERPCASARVSPVTGAPP